VIGCLRAGGQTGVDRAALDVALSRGLPYAGWCPAGGWAEDLPALPGLLAHYPHLTETPSTDPAQRTAWNVRDSHATLILVRGEELGRSPGTLFTRQCAELLYLRPCVVVDLSLPGALDSAREWLARAAAVLGGAEPVLHVAGPRESEAPGIYAAAREFLAGLLSQADDRG
jgi:hypothetical protein